MKIFKTVYYLLIYFVLTTSAYAANHYVRSGATGANNGNDWTNAWTTLPSTLTRGDTYYIAGGTYGTYTFDDAPSGSTYIYIKKATTSAHGTDTGWNSAYGTSQAVWTGQWRIRSDYLDIDGVTGGGPTNWEGPFGFKVMTTSDYGTGWAPRTIFFDATLVGAPYVGNYTNFKHIEITKANIPPNGYPNSPCTSTGNCDAWDDPLIFTSIAPVGNYVTFSHCWIHYSVKGMFVGNFNNWTVEYSKIGDNYGNVAEHSEIVASYGGNNTVFRYNYFYRWRSTGAFYTPSNYGQLSDWGIYGNIFDGNESQGLWVINCGSNEIESVGVNWKIYNNTFINLLNNSFVGVFGSRLGQTGNEMKNNIFWYTPGTGPRKIVMDASSWGGGPKNVTNDYNWYTGDTWYSSYGEANGINGGSADPFVNSSSDFHLTSAIQGLTLGTPYNKTMDGATRRIDGVYDRGAFEYNSGNSSLPSIVPLPPENLRIN
jgi:hypothetical protein